MSFLWCKNTRNKYHIQNVLSRAIINHVCKTFDLKNTVLPQGNKDRRRKISIKFIIHKLFEKWKLKFDIPITKSKKTLPDYEKYWKQVCLLTEL